jgi:hypothetical protein
MLWWNVALLLLCFAGLGSSRPPLGERSFSSKAVDAYIDQLKLKDG